MAETITPRHSGPGEIWNWANMMRDLQVQGGLKEVIIDPLSVGPRSVAGSLGENQFVVTWVKDELLLVSMQEFSQELVDAFTAVVEYPPFCRFTHPDSLVTVQWDKNDPEGRFRELEEEGFPDLQRLPQNGLEEVGLAENGQKAVVAARPMGFSVAPGVGAALVHRGDDRAYFVFQGDLNQMGILYARLLEAGFPVVKSDVYPGFPRDQEEEYIRALRFVFDNRIEGWWNQERDLIKHEICTQEEFDKALGRMPR